MTGLLVLLLALAGCSIGVQDEPDVVPMPRVSPTDTADSELGAVDLTLQVYLVHGSRLFRVTRSVSPGSGLEPVLKALGEPVGPEEVRAGLRTALPESTSVLRGTLASNGTATVSMPPGLDRLSVQEQQTAAAQIVFTVTADSLATRVQLVRSGRPVPVPDADGHLIERALTRADYARLAPRE